MATSWDELTSTLTDNNLQALADVVKELIIKYGPDAQDLIYQELRQTDVYKARFQGNTDLLAAGKTPLSEGEYLYNEKIYQQTFAAYNATDLINKDTYAKLISGEVSPVELQNRFNVAYNKVTNAVNSNDKALVDQLRLMYPGISDSEIAKSMMLGSDGSEYLKNRLNLADVKAGETEAGLKSSLGADYLSEQGLSRSDVRAGLSKVGEQLTGASLAAATYGIADQINVQSELEKENLLGQTGKGTKKLASQARAQMDLISGTAAGSLKQRAQV